MSRREGTGSAGSPSLLKSWRRYGADVDDGQWSAMIKPGQKGYGIIPWLMNMPACLESSMCGEEHTVFQSIPGDEPYIAPAFVVWESPIDTSEQTRKDVDSTYHMGLLDPQYEVGDMSMPLVYVTRMSYPDMNDPVTNSTQGFLSDEFYLQNGVAYGGGERLLLPAWSVTPVRGESWHTWQKEAAGHWSNDLQWTSWMGRMNQVNGHSHLCHGLDAQPTDEEGREIDIDPWEHPLEQCRCGLAEMEYKMVEDLDTVPLDAGIDTDRNQWEEVYDYAWDRWREGWKLCLDKASGERDAPSTDLGFSYSPFWVFDSLKALSQTELRAFANRMNYHFTNMIDWKSFDKTS